MISMIDKSLMFNYCERSCQAANLLVGEVRPLDAALQRNQYRLVRVCSPIIADRNSQIRLSKGIPKDIAKYDINVPLCKIVPATKLPIGRLRDTAELCKGSSLRVM